MAESASDRVFDQADDALKRLDRLKSFLVAAEALRVQDHARWFFLTQEARAACIIGVCAELEALTRVFLVAVNGEINRGVHVVGDLKPCLRGLAGHAHFESLRTSEDAATVWARRTAVTSYDTSTEVAAMPLPARGPQPPMDGKTLTPSHFQRLWDVYGLDGDPFPELAWATTLTKLSGLRNDIAHANLPFSEIFRTAGTTSPSVERALDQMNNFVIHLTVTWTSYVASQHYLA